MEIEVSQKTSKVCKSYKLSAEALAFADLCAVGWEPSDAYIVAFRKGSTWVKKALKEEVEKLSQMQGVKDRMAETKRVLSERQKEAVKSMTQKDMNSVVSNATSKEKMLYDLQLAKNDMTPGTKEWIDINKLIVDVTRMKQDEVKTEDTLVKYHLPVNYPTGCQDCLYQRCDTCKFKKEYLKMKERLENEEGD